MQLALMALPVAVATAPEVRPIKATKRKPTTALIAPWVRLIREAPQMLADGAPLRSPRDVWQFVAPDMETLEVEQFVVLILDAQHRVSARQMVTQGILNSSLVHPREVFRAAIALNAAAIVLVHNHPSGDPTPSQDDRAITSQLVAAGKLLDIPVADHLVIGRGRYLSFSEAGIL